jgi:hypothetical protein
MLRKITNGIQSSLSNRAISLETDTKHKNVIHEQMRWGCSKKVSFYRRRGSKQSSFVLWLRRRRFGSNTFGDVWSCGRVFVFPRLFDSSSSSLSLSGRGTPDASWVLGMHHEYSTHDASWVLIIHHEFSWCSCAWWRLDHLLEAPFGGARFGLLLVGVSLYLNVNIQCE